MPRRLKRRRDRPVVQWLVIGLLFLAGGAAGGYLWEWWWTPPSGVAVDDRFLLDPEGTATEFSGTGMYVVVALAGGLLLGLLATLVSRQRELARLAVVVVSSVAAGLVMMRVGLVLGPADPAVLARGAEDFSPLAPQLRVGGFVAYLAWPLGALAGLAAGFVIESGLISLREGRAPTP